MDSSPPAGLRAPAPGLERGVVQVHWFPTDLPEARLDELAPLLAEAELARAHRFHLLRDRNRYVAARGQMRILLASCLDGAPSAVAIEVGPHGKPEVPPAPGSERLQFNLSHSEGVGVLAITLEDELGIDVEGIRPLPEVVAIAGKFLAPGEVLALRAAADEARSETFFRYWTRKEAVVKSFGKGLTHSLDGFELSPDGLAPERVIFRGEDPPSARWVLPLTPPYPGFVAALATAGGLPEIRARHAPEGVFPRS